MIPTMAMRRSGAAMLTGNLRIVPFPRPAITFPARFEYPPVASSSRSKALRRSYATGSEAPSRADIPLEGESREQEIRVKLEEALKPTRLAIQDTSGGCGTFFNIDIESDAFQGMSKVKQHKEVMRILKQEITNEMHGVSLRTALPGQ